jgi:hypothetical protein
MSRARLSIATLLVAVGLIAVGFAALRVSSRLWANACFSAALLLLVVSVAEVIYRQGPPRAFWGGFALFGWTYFLAAFGPTWLAPWRDMLITAPALSILEEQLLETPAPTKPAVRGAIPPSTRVSSTGYSELSPWTYWTAPDRANPFSSDSFSRIGHSLCCIGIAMAGGVFCLYLRELRDSSSPPP